MGARAQTSWLDVHVRSNFGGTCPFANLTEFSSGRPIQFAVRRGNPDASFSEVDAGVFTEVDVRPLESVGIVGGLRGDHGGGQEELEDLVKRRHAKFWLAPAAIAWNHGFSPRELNEIRRLVVGHEAAIIEAWHEHCGQR